MKEYEEAKKPFVRIPSILASFLFSKKKLGRETRNILGTLIAYRQGVSYRKTKKENDIYSAKDDSFRMSDYKLSSLSGASRGLVQGRVILLIDFGFVEKISGRKSRQANKYILHIPNDLISIYTDKEKVHNWYENKMKEIKGRKGMKRINKRKIGENGAKQTKIDSISKELVIEKHKKSLAHEKGEQLSMFDIFRQGTTR